MRVKVSDLTPSQRAELEALMDLPDDEIDTDDIPEILEWRNPRRGLFAGSPSRKAEPEPETDLPGESGDGRRATDTSERGLEDIIFASMAGAGWIPGVSNDFAPESCVDLAQLSAFLGDTQPDTAEALALDGDNITRQRFLARLKRQVTDRGVVDVLRNGVRYRQHSVSLFYATPSAGNERAWELHALNRFSVTRQLRYSARNTGLALDLALFINGLPVATFELKNSLTKQTVADAEEQYRRDRDPREDLFRLGRCMAHFAVDDQQVRFCAELRGKASWFLPFNKGRDGGAGNPVNPDGLMTEYLWRDTLSRENLTDIIENYAQLIQTTDPKTRKKSRTQIWPRYHQLDVVRELLADAQENGAGQRYLVQHSAGSGKSNSIAWLAHRLVDLRRNDAPVLRLHHRRHRPAHSRRSDRGDHQTVHPGERDGGPRRAFKQPPRIHRGRQEDNHLHRAEVPVHPGRDERRLQRPQLRHHHRRGALQPGRPHVRGNVRRAFIEQLRG